MPDQYKVIHIEPDWNHGDEDMGSKAKFWYREPDNGGRRWLFKYPKQNTGEHWAEKIASEVAHFLNTEHAQVELAVFGNQHGSTTKSFVSWGWELWHGNQILEGVIAEYDPELRFHQSSHNLANIFQVFDTIDWGNSVAKKEKSKFAEYIVLDALIGNTDRHHENWGILFRSVYDNWKGILAPSFDHASSLGRELKDERRERLLAENRVGNYVEKGRGGIYWSEDDVRGPSPLELVRRAATHSPEIFQPALRKVQKLDKNAIGNIIDKVPDGWMSALARQFAHALMMYNLQQLTRIIP